MGDMNIKQDVEKGEDSTQEEIRKPLMQGQKNLPDAGGSGSEDQTDQSSKEHPWMVYLSTFVAVCGSFEFGSCVSAAAFSYTLLPYIYFFEFANHEPIKFPKETWFHWSTTAKQVYNCFQGCVTICW